MIEAKSLKELNEKLREISIELAGSSDEIKSEVGKVLFKGANKTRNTIIKSMRNTRRASHSYKRGDKIHFPSKEGSPPAIDKGNLIASILFDSNEDSIQLGSIITEPKYPQWLEEGTKKMKPRPWLNPAMNENRPEIIHNLGGVVPGVIGKIFEDIS